MHWWHSDGYHNEKHVHCAVVGSKNVSGYHDGVILWFFLWFVSNATQQKLNIQTDEQISNMSQLCCSQANTHDPIIHR